MNVNRIAILTLAIAGVLAGAPQARADDALNELSGSSSMALSFASGADTAFSADAAYSRLLIPDLVQGTLIAALLTSSGDTAYSVVAGPTLNFSLDDMGVADAIYLSAAIGLSHVNVGDASSTDFAHRIELGKRIPIVGHTVTWRPAFVASGTSATGGVEQFQLIPAQFSFLF